LKYTTTENFEPIRNIIAGEIKTIRPPCKKIHKRLLLYGPPEITSREIRELSVQERRTPQEGKSTFWKKVAKKKLSRQAGNIFGLNHDSFTEIKAWIQEQRALLESGSQHPNPKALKALLAQSQKKLLEGLREATIPFSRFRLYQKTLNLQKIAASLQTFALAKSIEKLSAEQQSKLDAMPKEVLQSDDLLSSIAAYKEIKTELSQKIAKISSQITLQTEGIAEGFPEATEAVLSFVQKSIPKLLTQHLTTKEGLSSFCEKTWNCVCELHLRSPFPNNIELYLRAKVAEGGWKNVYKFTYLYGPGQNGPRQFAPLIAYAKLKRFSTTGRSADQPGFRTFQNEQSTWQTLLDHKIRSIPNMKPVFKRRNPGELKAFAIEWCSGGSLYSRLRDKNLSLQQGLNIVLHTAYALQDLHKHKCVYHDLKPDNILLTNTNAKLTDFALLGKKDIKDSGIRSTATYTPPEQLNPSWIATPFMDGWQLGLILFEIKYGYGKNTFGSYYNRLDKDERDAFLADSEKIDFEKMSAGWAKSREEMVSQLDLTNRLDRLISTLLSMEPEKRFSIDGSTPSHSIAPVITELEKIIAEI